MTWWLLSILFTVAAVVAVVYLVEMIWLTMVFLYSITWSKRFNEQFFHNQIECNWIHRSAADHLNSHLYDHSIENGYTIILKMKGIKTGIHSIFLQITSSVRIFFSFYFQPVLLFVFLWAFQSFSIFDDFVIWPPVQKVKKKCVHLRLFLSICFTECAHPQKHNHLTEKNKK